MREFKFRAWDEKDKIMYSEKAMDLVIHFNGDLNSIDEEGDIIGTYYTKKMKLMQYTGLKDKKRTREYPDGQEIYEGDIVKGMALSRERIGVIVWIDELAGFGVRYRERNDPTAWEESSILKDIARHNYSEFQAEVIGNIYENPELLEGGE